MKALLSTAVGGPDTLELAELPDPQAGPGQLLVRVRACAINYPDVLMIEDKYQFKPPRPFAPGGEVAGIVEAVGEGVSGWAEGDRLIAMIGHGGLQEKVVIASGPVLLSGDQYHFTEQVKNRGVPPFNHDRADTLASMDRYDRIAGNLKARTVIQHEPADIARLPAFPKAAQ